MGLRRLVAVRVVHCPHSFALVLEGAKGWKLVYSGDTRPCPQLVRASEGATVVIHEATFDDGMRIEVRRWPRPGPKAPGGTHRDPQPQADKKRHSITREAVRVGSEAGAYRTLLTHFSQRYPKIPVFDASFQSNTCIAFDMMTVSLQDLPRLPRLLPSLAEFFKEEVPADDKAEAIPVMFD